MKQLSRIVRSVKAFSQEMSRQRDSAEAHTKLLPRPKLGLAFGGGFARGLAHIGILKVLEENPRRFYRRYQRGRRHWRSLC